MSSKKRVFEGQRLFTPNVVRRFTNSSGVLKRQTQAALSGSDEPMSVTGSFRFDPPGSPLKSTQQLPLNFDAWEEHTFFCSAEANVNIVFEKILNRYPFDGTRAELDTWLDELTGWEKYVLNRYPQYTGYLSLDGSNQYIKVVDKAGILFPALSKNKSGMTILNPGSNSVFIELDLALEAKANNNQFIFSHFSGSNVGYAAFIEASSSTVNAPVIFCMLSGSNMLSTRYYMEKGKFERLSFDYNRRPSSRRLRILSGSTAVAQSRRFNFRGINTDGHPFLIGSGSEITIGKKWIFTPANTLSGSINKLRIFNKTRTKKQLDYFCKRIFFAGDSSLLLNMRFNEPTGSYTNNSVVLDHSGNSLHSKITNYSTVIRSDKQYDSLITFQSAIPHPVLFPAYPDVITLNEGLLASASLYDANNPNMITKLVPQHYFEMAAQSDWTVGGDANGTLLDGITTVPESSSGPGGARMGQPQIISSLLFMWAREFDELKQMLDHVSDLVHIDYDKHESVADAFLPFLANYYGFKLPNMYRNATHNQLFSGEGVAGDNPVGNLLVVQNEMWRRVLINLREVFSSKGTVHAIKTLFRASGIDPDRMFRFIEYGGSPAFRLGSSRQKITEISSLVDFSGSFAGLIGTKDPQGHYSNRPTLISTYLTSSRVETGWPPIGGTFVDKTIFTPFGISNNVNDGLLTSGSWTLEGRYRFPVTRDFRNPQSLMRLHSTGAAERTGAAAAEQPMFLNVIADPAINKVTLFARPGFASTDPILELPLTGVNVFTGDKWYISVGRKRDDEAGAYISSSYFLNVARQDNGNLMEFYTTSSFFAESAAPGNNIFQKVTEENKYGPFLVIGTQSLGSDSSIQYLNNTTAVTASLSRVTDFGGRAGHFRFFSKALTRAEVKEHALNFTSVGVEDPLVNFGFTPDVTGSWSKLRLDLSCDQSVTASDGSGILTLIDFSQQSKKYRTKVPGTLSPILFNTASEFGGFLKGFETSKSVIVPERFNFSAISSYYDEVTQENKVRVAGFTEGKNLFDIGGRPAPIYELPRAHEPKDDARFSIEFSVMQALNEDIMKIFATLDSLDNIIGAPELMFADDYPGLADLRKVYFNRLTDTVNYKNFFDFFRWLDDSFDVMIENLIPRKTNYLGFNFILESHALERAKLAYGSGDVYLGESARRNLKGIILLRQLIAEIRKI